MPAQNWASEFMQAKAVAEARRQEAHRQAQATFDTERARITAERTALYERARDAWDAVKADPSHPDYDRCRAEFARIGSANYSPAHQALNDAVSRADTEYRATVGRLQQEQQARDRAAVKLNEPVRR